MNQYFLNLSEWKLQGKAGYETDEQIHKELGNKCGRHLPHGEVHYIGLAGVVKYVKVNVEEVSHEGYLWDCSQDTPGEEVIDWSPITLE